MAEINMEKIREDIQREIEEKGISGDLLRFSKTLPTGLDSPAFSLFVLQRYMVSVNENYFVDPSRPQGSGLKGTIKSLICKCIRFYIKPIVEDQNLFNISMRECLNQFNAYIKFEEENRLRLERIVDQVLSENRDLRRQLAQVQADTDQHGGAV